MLNQSCTTHHISNSRCTKMQKGYFVKHHIVPHGKMDLTNLLKHCGTTQLDVTSSMHFL